MVPHFKSVIQIKMFIVYFAMDPKSMVIFVPNIGIVKMIPLNISQ